MIAQRNNTWLVIDNNNTVLYKSKHNYNPSPQYKMNCFDASYHYVSYYDGFIEHFKDKIVLITQTDKKEFYLKSDNAMCVDDTPLVYFFDGTKKGYLNLETGDIESDILRDVRKEFSRLKAYNIDKKLSIGGSPYSLFEQELLIQELKDDGITTIINIMQKVKIKYDIKVLENEFEIENILIPDKNIPNIDSLDKIIDTINKSDKSYIYCDFESNILGVIVAYYLHIEYRYKGQYIFQKIEELKRDSMFCATELVMLKEQEEVYL